MDRSWKSALGAAGTAGVCAMLATVLWEGINPQEPKIAVRTGRNGHLKRVDAPAEPAAAPQEGEETPVVARPTLMTLAPTGIIEIQSEPVTPASPPAAPGPLIEMPDLPLSFV